ncbi:unnamed protein product [Protopolystoma xenopodis]|uniref:t-SNARE coiled-coil homology domain-containing protein n=1 Tax=Protopolystoma xenopodis TaxID=117903 RepID=A0A448WGC3_9PLAT|nr:unnamed protein product [Protopolystoma xenopodis]
MALAIPGLARPFNIQHQHQLQLLRGDENLLIDANQSYYSARANAMLNIEHTIVELGEIFQQLATMVHEQDESVRRIDANLDEASTRIEAGHSELVKYLQSISSNRWFLPLSSVSLQKNP